MKILLVSDQFESGGASRVAAIMCFGFVDHGYEIHIAADFTNFSQKYDLPSEAKLHDVSFVSIGTSAIKKTISLFKIAEDIRHVIKKIRPDVIIAIHANAYVRTLVANRFTRIPLIVADHTSFARKMDFINTLTRHHLYKYADGISILSKRDERILGKKYPQKRVIYNPLTYSIYSGQSPRRSSILCAGRFDVWKIKGFDIMIDVWYKLANKYPDWTLEFAGTGTEESVNHIKKLVIDRNLQNRVTFLGYINDMKKLYRECGIFALPSRVEGMPMVLLEAMSQGCPCVAFSIDGASREIIADGTGIVVDDGDVKSFSDSIGSLIENASKRCEMSKKSTACVEKFSTSCFISNWIKFISDVTKK